MAELSDNKTLLVARSSYRGTWVGFLRTLIQTSRLYQTFLELTSSTHDDLAKACLARVSELVEEWGVQIDDPNSAGRRASSFSDLIGREVVSASCGAVSRDSIKPGALHHHHIMNMTRCCLSSAIGIDHTASICLKTALNEPE